MKPLKMDNSQYTILGPVDQIWLALAWHQSFKEGEGLALGPNAVEGQSFEEVLVILWIHFCFAWVELGQLRKMSYDFTGWCWSQVRTAFGTKLRLNPALMGKSDYLGFPPRKEQLVPACSVHPGLGLCASGGTTESDINTQQLALLLFFPLSSSLSPRSQFRDFKSLSVFWNAEDSSLRSCSLLKG